jgi:hypothetical protein
MFGGSPLASATWDFVRLGWPVLLIVKSPMCFAIRKKADQKLIIDRMLSHVFTWSG